MIARISKKDKFVKGAIDLPPSKSIFNRVLIIRALSDADFSISSGALANDSMLLERLLNSNEPIIDAEDAGTTFRFLTAYLSQRPGEYVLTGTARMKQRPIGILVEGLKELGADISYIEKDGYPPLKIRGKKLKGREIEVEGNISSQFISAIMMIAPIIEGGLQLNIKGEIFSRPYVEMTLKVMGEFGVNVEWIGNSIKVPEGQYIPKNYIIEPDWSAASYWYEITALSEESEINLPGLPKSSIQGDAVVEKIMRPFGVQTEYLEDGIRITKNSKLYPKIFSYNFEACPDLFQTIAATSAALNIQTDFKGVENVRIKETDRIVAIKNELRKVQQGINSPIRFQTYNDHRMAMCLAPLVLKLGEIEIENPYVVKKSYPNFWNDLTSVGFNVAFY